MQSCKGCRHIALLVRKQIRNHRPQRCHTVRFGRPLGSLTQRIEKAIEFPLCAQQNVKAQAPRLDDRGKLLGPVPMLAEPLRQIPRRHAAPLRAT